MLFSAAALGVDARSGPPACQGVKGKPVISRERANQDVDELIAYDLAPKARSGRHSASSMPWNRPTLTGWVSRACPPGTRRCG